jgi:iron complex outermembrane receptor protein
MRVEKKRRAITYAMLVAIAICRGTYAQAAAASEVTAADDSNELVATQPREQNAQAPTQGVRGKPTGREALREDTSVGSNALRTESEQIVPAPAEKTSDVVSTEKSLGVAQAETRSDPSQEQKAPENAASSNDQSTVKSKEKSSPTKIDTSQDIEEIVVTAQKREQSLNDVGITATVVTGQRLEAVGVTDITQLGKVVPGFTAQPTSQDGNPEYTIRGIGFNPTQISALPTVSTYIDEAPLSYTVLTRGALFDLERVEVLKGPQGTLFGQNSTGGAINLVTAKPTDVITGGTQASVNQYGQFSTEDFISGPVSETLRGRLAATLTEGGPWQEGFTTDRKFGQADRGGARLLLDWTPTDRVKTEIDFNTYIDRSELQLIQLYAVSPTVPGQELPSLDAYPLPPPNDRAADVSPNLRPRMDSDFYQGAVRSDFGLANNMKLTSITSLVGYQGRSSVDVDATTLNISNSYTRNQVHSFFEEFRLAGTVPTPAINYLFGVNYQDDRINEQILRDFYHYSAFDGAFVSLENTSVSKYDSIGYFGNADIDLTRQLTLTGGVRYTVIRQGLKGCTEDSGDGTAAALIGSVANALRAAEGLGTTTAYSPGSCILLGPPPGYNPVATDLSSKVDNVSWRGGVNYKPDPDSLLYALISRGFKAGGFPVVLVFSPDVISDVKQERLTDYEIGTKLSLLDRAVQLNASIFYYEYENKQLNAYVSSPPFLPETLANIPQSTAKGIDMDAVVRPLSGLVLRGAMTYLKTRIGNYVGLNSVGNPQVLTGNPFNFSPTVSGVADIEYRFAAAAGLEPFVGASAQYNSKTNADLAESPEYAIESYATYDLRLGVSSQSGWRATAWVRNVTNKYYWTNVLILTDTLGRFTGLPRTVGVTLAYTF